MPSPSPAETLRLPVTDAEACRTWLAGLTESERDPAASALIDALAASGDLPGRRYAIAEQVRPAHLKALERAAAALRGAVFPMPLEQRRQAAELLQEFAAGRELYARLHAELSDEAGGPARTIIPGTTASLQGILPLIRALDYQSRLILAQQAHRLRVGTQDWDRLCMQAIHVRASSFQDEVFPDETPLMGSPTARALFVAPLLVALAAPAARGDAELAVVVRLARRWAAGVGFRIDAGTAVRPGVAGPVLGLSALHAVRLDTQKLLPRLRAQRDALEGLDVRGVPPLPRGLTLAATTALLDLLERRWAPGHVVLALPDAPIGRMRLRFGFPAGASTDLAPWAVEAERVDWVAIERGEWFFERELAQPVAIGDLVTLVPPALEGRPTSPRRPGLADRLMVGRVTSLAQRLSDDLTLPPVQRVGVLAWSGAPSLVRVHGGGRRGWRDAVRLTDDGATGEPRTLLLPAGVYSAGATLALRDGAAAGSIRLLEVLERSAAFERMGYEPATG
jgi:hypothetical protein